MSQAKLSHQLGTAGMFSCSPGRERAKGSRTGLSQPPLGTNHVGLCPPGRGGRAAPSPGDTAGALAVAGTVGQGMTGTAGRANLRLLPLPFLQAPAPCALAAPLNNSTFIAEGFVFPVWLVEQSFPPGAQRPDEKLCLAPAGKRHQPGGQGRKCCLFGASIAIACTGHELGLEFNVHTIRD